MMGNLLVTRNHDMKCKPGLFVAGEEIKAYLI
jgi:hypothetical protein